MEYALPVDTKRALKEGEETSGAPPAASHGSCSPPTFWTGSCW